MRDDSAPAWFDDELEVPERGRRRLVIIVTLAVIPWLAIAAFVIRGAISTPGNTTTRVAALGDVHDAASEAPSDPDVPPGDPGADDDPPTDGDHAAPEPADTSSGDATPGPVPAVAATPGVGDASAVAVAVARAWLSDAGPDLAISGIDPDRRAYLEHVTVRQVELLAADSAVATLSVVLLVREDDRYVEALLRRVAVPLSLDETTVHPGGQPWWLPNDGELVLHAPETVPLDDPDELAAAGDALEDAGYVDVEVAALATGAGDLVVATATATAATGEEIDGDVWLASDEGTYVVVGAPPDARATDRRAPDASGRAHDEPTDEPTDDPTTDQTADQTTDPGGTP